jgi:hypothetical protein
VAVPLEKAEKMGTDIVDGTHVFRISTKRRRAAWARPRRGFTAHRPTM